jgi:hypothetical protein
MTFTFTDALYDSSTEFAPKCDKTRICSKVEISKNKFIKFRVTDHLVFITVYRRAHQATI